MIFGACLFLLLFLAALFLLSKNFEKPALLLPKTHKLQGKSISLFHVPYFLKLLAFFLLCIGFIAPEKDILLPKKKIEEQGALLYLLLDQSGSMAEPAQGKDQQTKFSLLKQVASHFIHSYKGSLGIISFARAAEVISPITLDKSALQERLQALEPLREPENQGTAIGYAILKAAEYLEATRNSPNQVAALILLTDGVQNPHPDDQIHSKRSLDILSAAKIAKEKNMYLFILNMEPEILTSKFDAQRNLLRRSAEITKGSFKVSSEAKNLEDELSAISTFTEKTYVDSQEKIAQKKSGSAFFLIFACLFLLLSEMLELFWIRSIP
jgi:Ca-activated chloride channel homolog